MGIRRSVNVVGNKSYPTKKGAAVKAAQAEKIRELEKEVIELKESNEMLNAELNNMHYIWAAVTIGTAVVMGIVYAVFG